MRWVLNVCFDKAPIAIGVRILVLTSNTTKNRRNSVGLIAIREV